MVEIKDFKRPRDETFDAVVRELEKLGYITNLCKKKKVCFQAGANVGVFPSYLSNEFDRVYTAEPCLKTYSYLVENIKDRKNIQYGNFGLGKAPSSAIMIEVEVNCGANYTEISESGNIEIKTIDSILEFETSLDLLYLDIEGAEYDAILGASESISKFKPVIVLENKGLIKGFESDLNGSVEFRNFICSLGYKHVNRMMRDDVFVSEV